MVEQLLYDISHLKEITTVYPFAPPIDTQPLIYTQKLTGIYYAGNRLHLKVYMYFKQV